MKKRKEYTQQIQALISQVPTNKLNELALVLALCNQQYHEDVARMEISLMNKTHYQLQNILDNLIGMSMK